MNGKNYLRLLYVGLLTFASGYTNTMTMILFMIPVTYMTGALTKISTTLVKINVFSTLIFVLVPIIFVASAMASSILFKKQKTQIHWAFLLMAGILILLPHLSLSLEQMILVLVGIAGFQNAIPIIDNMAIRTTHLTGVLTDIGILCSDYYCFKKVNTLKLVISIISVLAFIAGGLFVLLFPVDQSLLFFVLAGIYMVIACVSKKYYVRGFYE